ncbi:hypothetical protein BX070DRAFT_225901 [Coemansia spiralis]|nr:hypothetical protein BX070DRAFT_225901 [Coemansia spiralis]
MPNQIEDEDTFLYGDLETTAGDDSQYRENDDTMDQDAVPRGKSSLLNGGNKEADDLMEYSDMDVRVDDSEGNQIDDNAQKSEGDAAESGSDDSSDEDDDLEVILEPGGADVGKQADTQAASAEGTVLDGLDGRSKAGDSSMQALFAGGADRMDILTVPLINNMDMYTIDLDMLEEKPWRQPGADITDYFNFGFNEETWKIYCMKQKWCRNEFNTRKMMPPMMMMPGNAGMAMANPAMFSAMMNPGFRPEMAGNMYPPGNVPPPFVRQGQGQGQQGIAAQAGIGQSGQWPSGADGDATSSSNINSATSKSDSKDDSTALQNKEGGMPSRIAGAQQQPNPMQMTPQMLQFQQQNQQQQMRMGMPPGYFPANNFPPGMSGQQRNIQMSALPPQLQMQMQMQMQMNGGRMAIPQNPQAMHQRPNPNIGTSPNMNNMQRPPNALPPQTPQRMQDTEKRDSDKGSESGRTSRHHTSRERSESQHRHRDWDNARNSSRSRHERDKDRSENRRDVSRSERDRSVADKRRSDRHGRDKDRSERTARGHDSTPSRGDERSDRYSHKRRQTSAKSSSRRRR